MQMALTHALVRYKQMTSGSLARYSLTRPPKQKTNKQTLPTLGFIEYYSNSTGCRVRFFYYRLERKSLLLRP